MYDVPIINLHDFSTGEYLNVNIVWNFFNIGAKYVTTLTGL